MDFRCLYDCLLMRTWIGWFPFPSNPRRKFKPLSTRALANSQSLLRGLAKGSEHTSNPVVGINDLGTLEIGNRYVPLMLRKKSFGLRQI